MRFIVAVLAFGLAGSAGWAANHFVVQFIWPEAGVYGACLAAELYLLGFAPTLRHPTRRILTSCMFGCIIYLGWIAWRGGASFPEMAKVGVAIVYLFVMRYLTDRSFERGLRKVLLQIRYQGPTRSAVFAKWVLGCIACLGAFCICVKYIEAYEHQHQYSAIVLVVPFLACTLFTLCVFTIFEFFSLLGIFIPSDGQPYTPKPQEIFTTGRPATLGQLDTAARGGASNVVPLRFKD